MPAMVGEEKFCVSPSGCTQTWRLWRHCCCRYGWYPLIITPIVTAGFLLSIYSSLGCSFMILKVGFTPSNDAWNQSTAEFGLFHFQSGLEESNKFPTAFVDGCRRYSDEFESMFVKGDRTWKVARIMAFISGISSFVATITVWSLLVSPLPACFFWPGVLLPAVAIAFLAEGSKFLFFDTSICHSQLWFPSGADSLPQVAESCQLGDMGKVAIAAGSTFFFTLLLVCLKAPEKRLLDENYGVRPDDHDLESARVLRLCPPGSPSHDAYDDNGSDYVVRNNSSGSAMDRRYSGSGYRNSDDVSEDAAYSTATSKVARHHEFEENSSGGSSRDARDPVGLRDRSQESREGSACSQKRSASSDLEKDCNEVKKPPAQQEHIQETQQRISQSRISKIEKMKLNVSDDSADLINKFVTDLDQSFQYDEVASEANSTRMY